MWPWNACEASEGDGVVFGLVAATLVVEPTATLYFNDSRDTSMIHLQIAHPRVLPA